MNKETSRFGEYTFNYYFRPGQSLDDKENLQLFDKMTEFNDQTYKFNFGLFSPNIPFSKVKEIFQDAVICLIYHDSRVVGFFYFFILNEKYKVPLVQLGLIAISKNTGHDLFSISEKIGLLYTYKKLGFFNSAIITTIPKIVEEFSLTYSDTWPTPHRDLSRAPKEYKNYLTDVGERYVKLFFPNPFTINKRRFTLILDKREAGFHDRFHSLSMARSFEFNSFCKSWINYEENEDLIVMGRFDWKALLRTRLFLLRHRLAISLFSLRNSGTRR